MTLLEVRYDQPIIILSLGLYGTINRVIDIFSQTVRLIVSYFYLVNTIEIKQYNLSKMRSYVY